MAQQAAVRRSRKNVTAQLPPVPTQTDHTLEGIDLLNIPDPVLYVRREGEAVQDDGRAFYVPMEPEPEIPEPAADIQAETLRRDTGPEVYNPHKTTAEVQIPRRRDKDSGIPGTNGSASGSERGTGRAGKNRAGESRHNKNRQADTHEEEIGTGDPEVRSALEGEESPAAENLNDTLRIPAYLLQDMAVRRDAKEEGKRNPAVPSFDRAQEPPVEAPRRKRPSTGSGSVKKRRRRRLSPEEAAYRRQALEEERERDEIRAEQSRIEEEQRVLKEQAARQKEEESRLKEQAERQNKEGLALRQQAERQAEEEQQLREEAKRQRRQKETLRRREENAEAYISAEVDRRVRRAKDEISAQVVVAPAPSRARKAVMVWVVIGVTILAFISLILGIRYDRMRRQLDESREDLEWYRELVSGTEITGTDAETLTQAADGSDQSVLPSDGIRRVYLTFDDGPSEVTTEILDILAQYNVKATFFVLGRTDENSKAIYKRIVDEGHTIAMHSFTHDYSSVYESLDSFQTDLHRLQNLIYDETGVWCTIYRFPGGSSNTATNVPMSELIDYLERENITYYDWNVYGGDDISAELIVSNVKANLEGYANAVVLMHDAADKEETAQALPQILEYIMGLENTQILPITEETAPVQHGT